MRRAACAHTPRTCRVGCPQLPDSIQLRLLRAHSKDNDIAALSKGMHKALLAGDPRRLSVRLRAAREGECIQLLTLLQAWGRQHPTRLTICEQPRLLFSVRLLAVTELLMCDVSVAAPPNLQRCMPNLRRLELLDVKGMGPILQLREMAQLQCLCVDDCPGLMELETGPALRQLQLTSEFLARVDVSDDAQLEVLEWWVALPPPNLQASRNCLRVLRLEAQQRIDGQRVEGDGVPFFLALPDMCLDLEGFTRLEHLDLRTYPMLQSVNVKGCVALRHLSLPWSGKPPPPVLLLDSGCGGLETLLGCTSAAQLEAARAHGRLRRLQLRGCSPARLSSAPLLHSIVQLQLAQCVLPAQLDRRCLPSGLELLSIRECSGAREGTRVDVTGCKLKQVIITDTCDVHTLVLGAGVQDLLLRDVDDLQELVMHESVPEMVIDYCTQLIKVIVGPQRVYDDDDMW